MFTMPSSGAFLFFSNCHLMRGYFDLLFKFLRNKSIRCFWFCFSSNFTSEEKFFFFTRFKFFFGFYWQLCKRDFFRNFTTSTFHFETFMRNAKKQQLGIFKRNETKIAQQITHQNYELITSLKRTNF